MKLNPDIFLYFTEWFYYSPTGDLTNTQQRERGKDHSGPDNRFFWNQHMLEDLFEAVSIRCVVNICDRFAV